MKCDSCQKIIWVGQSFIQDVGSFDQPLFFCDDKCKKDFWNENISSTEVNQDD